MAVRHKIPGAVHTIADRDGPDSHDKHMGTAALFLPVTPPLSYQLWSLTLAWCYDGVTDWGKCPLILVFSCWFEKYGWSKATRPHSYFYSFKTSHDFWTDLSCSPQKPLGTLLLATRNIETINAFNRLNQTRWIVNTPEIQKLGC